MGSQPKIDIRNREKSIVRSGDVNRIFKKLTEKGPPKKEEIKKDLPKDLFIGPPGPGKTELWKKWS